MTRSFLRRIAPVLLLAACLPQGERAPPAPPRAAGAGFTLTILHTNDVHSHLLPQNRSGGPCTETQARTDECWGGVARIAAFIKAERERLTAAGKAVLVLDAGDQFQGSRFFTRYQGKAEQEVMNLIGYQAMAVGNHEFDLGPEVLGRFADGLNLPLVSANLGVHRVQALAGRIRPSVILEAGGHKIGVVGATIESTATISRPGPDVRVGDVDESLPPVIAKLRRDGAEMVILLCHDGIEHDKRTAKAVPGIDLIVGGHSHTLLDDSGNPAAKGPYPTVVPGSDGAAVPIVQSWAYARTVGEITVTVDAAGHPVSWEGGQVFLTAERPQDPVIQAELARLDAPLKVERQRILGQATAPFDKEPCSHEECAIGEFAADTLLQGVVGADLAIQNTAGLRGQFAAGPITSGDVDTMEPFGNRVASVRVTGATIKAVLEHAVSHGRLNAQVAGLAWTVDWTRPPGDRVTRLVLTSRGRHEPLAMARRYTLATLDYLRQGGDGMTMLRDESDSVNDFGPDNAELLKRAVQRRTPLVPHLDGRIVVIGKPVPDDIKE